MKTPIEHWRKLGLVASDDVIEMYRRIREPKCHRGKLEQTPASVALELARRAIETRRCWLRDVAEAVTGKDYTKAMFFARLAAEIV